MSLVPLVEKWIQESRARARRSLSPRSEIAYRQDVAARIAKVLEYPPADRPDPADLVATEQLPAGPAAKDRVRDAITKIERIAEINAEIKRENGGLTAKQLSTCWFCEREPCSKAASYDLDLYHNFRREWNRVTWQEGQLSIPRCGGCSSKHTRKGRIRTLRSLPFFIAKIVLVVSFGALGVALFGPWGLLAGLPGFWICDFWLEGWKFRSIDGDNLDNEALRAADYPPLQMKLQTGWRLGKPHLPLR